MKSQCKSYADKKRPKKGKDWDTKWFMEKLFEPPATKANVLTHIGLWPTATKLNPSWKTEVSKSASIKPWGGICFPFQIYKDMIKLKLDHYLHVFWYFGEKNYARFWIIYVDRVIKNNCFWAIAVNSFEVLKSLMPYFEQLV